MDIQTGRVHTCAAAAPSTNLYAPRNPLHHYSGGVSAPHCTLRGSLTATSRRGTPEEASHLLLLTCHTPTCSMCKGFRPVQGRRWGECPAAPSTHHSQKAELRAAVEALGDANAVLRPAAQMGSLARRCGRTQSCRKRRPGRELDLLYAVLSAQRAAALERVPRRR
ncbi:unnamed protein product [Arctogadus glacialis]